MTDSPPAAPRGRVLGSASFEERPARPRDRALFALFDGLMALAGGVLRLGGRPLKEAIVRSFGAIGYAFGKRWRSIALINLDLAYGDALSEAEKRRIVRGMFRHFIRTGLDFLFDHVYWPRERLYRATRDADVAVLDAARKQGGYVAMTGHLGNIELIQRTFAAHGFAHVTIYKRFHGRWFDRYVARKRLAAGIGLIEVPKQRRDAEGAAAAGRGMRAVVESVWDQGLGLNFACDQRPRGGAFKIEFLGVPETVTQVGAILYAVRRRIPLTFHAMVYDARGEPKWILEGPIAIEDQPGGPEATLRHYVQRFNDWLGDRIREYPEQYAWGHRRFERDLYTRPRRAAAA